MVQIQHQHQGIGQKWQGCQGRFQHPAKVRLTPLLHRPGNAERAAEADEGIAHIKNAGDQHAHRPQKALGKGQGKGADIIARQILNKISLLPPGTLSLQQPAQGHVQDAAPQTQQGDGQKIGLHRLSGCAGKDGRRQSDADDDLGQQAKGLRPEKAGAAQNVAQCNDGHKAPRPGENIQHSIASFFNFLSLQGRQWIRRDHFCPNQFWQKSRHRRQLGWTISHFLQYAHRAAYLQKSGSRRSGFS